MQAWLLVPQSNVQSRWGRPCLTARFFWLDTGEGFQINRHGCSISWKLFPANRFRAHHQIKATPGQWRRRRWERHWETRKRLWSYNPERPPRRYQKVLHLVLPRWQLAELENWKHNTLEVWLQLGRRRNDLWVCVPWWCQLLLKLWNKTRKTSS